MKRAFLCGLQACLIALAAVFPAELPAAKARKWLESVSISGESSVVIGGTVTLTATAKYSDGTTAKLSGAEWSSNKTSVATVSGGAVSGKTKGKAVITASFTYGMITKSATKTITVDRELLYLDVTGASTVAWGDMIKWSCKAKFKDGGLETVKPTWKSTDTAVATVSPNGVVTGKKGGKATISATYTYNGVTRNAAGSITVVRKFKSMTVTGKSTVAAGEKITLKAVVEFNDGSKEAVAAEWSSSRSSVATVSKAGQVTGKKDGTATIKAKTTVDGTERSATRKVTVSKKLKSITVIISPSDTVSIGKTATLKVNAKYTDGSNAMVTPTWSNANKGIAAVSASGVVTGKKRGAAKITAKYSSGGVTCSSTISIKVRNPVQKLELKVTNTMIAAGKRTDIRAVATYADGSTKDVTRQCGWQSGGLKRYFYSDGSCLVGGGKVGTYKIKATYSYDGGTFFATKKITVKTEKKLKDLKLKPTTMTLKAGETRTIDVWAYYSGSEKRKVIADGCKSADPDIASVSAAGKVTAKKKGSTTITVMYTEGGVSKKRRICKITVK